MILKTLPLPNSLSTVMFLLSIVYFRYLISIMPVFLGVLLLIESVVYFIAVVSSSSSNVNISFPSINTLPEVGVSSAPIILRSVLFPEPDSPTTATNSPLETEKFTSLSA